MGGGSEDTSKCTRNAPGGFSARVTNPHEEEHEYGRWFYKEKHSKSRIRAEELGDNQAEIKMSLIQELGSETEPK